MSEAALLWQCEWCQAYNAPALEKCGSCLEKPSLKTLVSDDKPSKAKRGKSLSKPQKGASKQHGNKVVAFGHVFDSKIEYERFVFLRDCETEGLISSLQVHPIFVLAPKVSLPANAYRPKKSVQGAITYTPDFAYIAGGVAVYEDTKGAYGNSKKNIANKKAGKPIVTEAARLRHKLFIAQLASTGKDFHFRLVTSPTLETIYVEKRNAA
jgi:hypothetical protein